MIYHVLSLLSTECPLSSALNQSSVYPTSNRSVFLTKQAMCLWCLGTLCFSSYVFTIKGTSQSKQLTGNFQNIVIERAAQSWGSECPGMVGRTDKQQLEPFASYDCLCHQKGFLERWLSKVHSCVTLVFFRVWGYTIQFVMQEIKNGNSRVSVWPCDP